MRELFASPYFGIAVSIGAYCVGLWINRKTGSSLANPLLIAVALVIGVLLVFDIPYSDYNVGGNVINLFLVPATVTLALSIYRNFEVMKQNLIPVLSGAAAGSVTSMTSVYALCKLFGLDERLTASMLPKSVTTAIAIELSAQRGGLPSITVAAVMVTGLFGAVAAPYLVKLLRIRNPVAVGVAIGTSSHAAGTSKAVEIGEIEGAMSGLAISTAGLCTVLFSLILK